MQRLIAGSGPATGEQNAGCVPSRRWRWLCPYLQGQRYASNSNQGRFHRERSRRPYLRQGLLLNCGSFATTPRTRSSDCRQDPEKGRSPCHQTQLSGRRTELSRPPGLWPNLRHRRRPRRRRPLHSRSRRSSMSAHHHPHPAPTHRGWSAPMNKQADSCPCPWPRRHRFLGCIHQPTRPRANAAKDSIATANVTINFFILAPPRLLALIRLCAWAPTKSTGFVRGQTDCPITPDRWDAPSGTGGIPPGAGFRPAPIGASERHLSSV